MNDDPAILNFVADHGGFFDCVSQTEINIILNCLEVNPSRLMYSDIYKPATVMEHAFNKGIMLTCFDAESELIKISQYMPQAKLILVIRSVSINLNYFNKARATEGKPSVDVCPHGAFIVKYGAPRSKWESLLCLGKSLDLEIVGVKVDVGLHCQDSNDYVNAFHCAREVFTMGIEYGFDMSILDLGSGFPDDVPNDEPLVSFEEAAEKIRRTLNLLFPDGNIQMIAEPGMFLTRQSMCLATRVRNSLRDI